jgi:polar amino acid transport system permease protein
VVQLFFWYYGVGILFGFNIFPNTIDIGFTTVAGGLVAGIAALGFAEGGYVSEIFRGSINAVDVGQREAGQAIGMTDGQIMRRLILPQAIRIMLPTMGNQFNSMLKYTSLLAFIGVYEIFRDAQVYYSASYLPAEAFLGVAIWYLVLAAVWQCVQSIIERRADLRRRPPKRTDRSSPRLRELRRAPWGAR